MKKVKFISKTGKKSHISVDQNKLRSKIISIVGDDRKPYTVSECLNVSFTQFPKRVNYQRFDYSDGSFEYREM